MWKRLVLLPALVVLAGSLAPAFGQAPLLQRLRRMLPVENPGLVTGVPADLDNDGDLDFVLGGFGNPLALRENVGTGKLVEVAGGLPATIGDVVALDVGDVDGDGDLDIIATGSAADVLLLGDGTGLFSDASLNLPGGHGPLVTDIDLADVDGDGDLDALLGLHFEQDQLLLNSGAGVFSDASGNLPLDNGLRSQNELADMDGDGDPDIVVRPGGASTTFRIDLNDGTGVFATSINPLPLGVDITFFFALGDVDGDLDLDVFSADVVGARLFLNSGAGFLTEAPGALPALQSNVLTPGDVDGDGDLDVVNSSHFLSPPWRCYRNDGAGVFTELVGLPDLPMSNTPAPVLANVDGDGDLDLYIPERRLLLNDGAGTFADVTAGLPDELTTTFDVELGDLDGDGDVDAIVSELGAQGRLLLNQGNGAFVTGPVPFPGFMLLDLELGDVDADGDLDALVALPRTLSLAPQVGLFAGDGLGGFNDISGSLPLLAINPLDLDLADVDGDGDLDALIGTDAATSNALLLNGGAGVFTDAAGNLPASLDTTLAIAPGDVDGDGDIDLLLGNNTQQNRLLLNNGAGVFFDATGNLPVALDPTTDIELGDLNGDGTLDAIVANQAAPDAYHINLGGGVFLDVSVLIPGGVDLGTGVDLADFDGDGDLDVFGLGNFGGPGVLLLNAGSATGVFTDESARLEPVDAGSTRFSAAGDLDGDGDVDLWAGGFTFALFNHTRQLAYRATPRVGKVLTLDVAGPPSGAWILAASTGTASLFLPGFGTLRLDAAALFVVGSGPLDGDGRAAVDLPVPPDPSLVGVTLDWQALVGPPLRFTNLEITALTNL